MTGAHIQVGPSGASGHSSFFPGLVSFSSGVRLPMPCPARGDGVMAGERPLVASPPRRRAVTLMIRGGGSLCGLVHSLSRTGPQWVTAQVNLQG